MKPRDIQLHHPDFVEDKELQFLIENPKSTLTKILNEPAIESATIRSVVNGMVRSSRGARGVNIRGVEPVLEAKVSQIDTKLVEGKYFSAEKKNEILLSERLREKLKLKLRKKVVLQFQDLNGDITSRCF